jgi:hypothetical protein
MVEYESDHYSWVIGENAFSAEPDPTHPGRYEVRFYYIDRGLVLEDRAIGVKQVERSEKPRYLSYARIDQIPGAKKIPTLSELQAEGYEFVELSGFAEFLINHAKREAWELIASYPKAVAAVPEKGYFHASTDGRSWLFVEFPYEKLVAYLEEEKKPTQKKFLPKTGRVVATLMLSIHNEEPIDIVWLNPKRYEDEKYYKREWWVRRAQYSDSKPPIPFSVIHNVWRIVVRERAYENTFYILETDKGWFGIHTEGYFEGYAVDVYQWEEGELYEIRSKLEPRYDPEIGAYLEVVGEEKKPAAISEPAAVRVNRLLGEILREVR